MSVGSSFSILPSLALEMSGGGEVFLCCEDIFVCYFFDSLSICSLTVSEHSSVYVCISLLCELDEGGRERERRGILVGLHAQGGAGCRAARSRDLEIMT